ncbi:MAG: NAD(P)/FAD-dependent oxidoreductase [Nitrospina sp.]|jgi:phytoene dehydrogenase-like protein|nr:NAD(P)/FAD-dependent oxidoreductase [Nitrospina sp.]MBT3875312.1 NAD(P)/FAD-dependent oxidoreductase [Nitrospina sp.]MBT4048603.1 NAD(P)/FAD-dependent oxidoreductase [Nitrospina sp.]MBT4559031.1 NAD(P)/FAD-dependent oxidoreductase [Nitrospina sp.]MBT5348318.1 NAD(P)/FAD-dependent oxidoreductase [Nitrospina sp.]
MRYDTIVIGAGLSGLAAGIRLAMFDKKVCIVEKHVELGGLNSFYVRKNRTFDVGLHAMTNFTAKGVRSSPLGKLLKQLRFSHDDFRLCQQEISEIRFPENSLRFTNDFEFMRQEVAEQFPHQIDGFNKLVEKILSFDELNLDDSVPLLSRPVLESFINDPVLIDMLFCPLMYYGNAREGDMDFYQFVIMFKSIFVEGFSKPQGGMHYILNLMAEKFKNLGGELKMGNGIKTINAKQGTVYSVTLENEEELETETVLSSMGYVETLNRCQPEIAEAGECDTGQVSFMESLFVVDREPRDLGYDKSIVFFSTQPRFDYKVPGDLIDISSGVLCCSNNFKYPEPLDDGLIRLTNLASFGKWDSLPRKDYISAKKAWRARALEALFTFFPDFSENVVFLDSFTPKTIKKYTGHINGAVYGSPKKIKNGITPVNNLFICGTDQGFLGIIGATLSGISMANLHLLK